MKSPYIITFTFFLHFTTCMSSESGNWTVTTTTATTGSVTGSTNNETTEAYHSRNATTPKNRYRTANSTNSCRVYCGDWVSDMCENKCVCRTTNGDEPFLCILNEEADFYKEASRYA
ncbi:uncharacterized protein LOC142574168 [Dermacentor variabilis]|uniref:uncharacterized protein LOC142574168 n=1 Tax=Dermacentor variabilis TaxID=34621 RepID=UPI003F5C2160